MLAEGMTKTSARKVRMIRKAMTAPRIQGPSCTFIWFREFGLSLANMALIGFLTILILLLVRFPARLESPIDTSTSEPELEPSS